MRRRVLFMINSMAGGGSERQTSLLLRHINRDVFQPELYLTHRAGPLLDTLPDDVPVHAYDDVSTPGGIYFPGRALRQQASHVQQLIHSRSIDVIYDRTFHMTMIAGAAADPIKVPRVSTIVSPPDFALPLVEKKFVALKRRRLSKAYKQSKAVVTVSNQAARSAEAYYGLTSNSVIVVPNPIDLEQIRSDATQLCPAESTEDRMTIVVVSRMTEEKGHRDLFNALDLTEDRWPPGIPKVRVLLIGDGALRSELETRYAEATHGHEIVFMGLTTNPAPCVAAADALILPSHFEGMPNVVLEAMALGTPVIATAAGGTVELQDQEPTILFVNPRDPAAIAQQLIKFVQDPDAARLHVNAATEYVNRHHDVSQTINKIEQLLS